MTQGGGDSGNEPSKWMFDDLAKLVWGKASGFVDMLLGDFDSLVVYGVKAKDVLMPLLEQRGLVYDTKWRDDVADTTELLPQVMGTDGFAFRLGWLCQMPRANTVMFRTHPSHGTPSDRL